METDDQSMTIPVIIKRGVIHQGSGIGGLCVTFILLERSAVQAALFKRIDYNPAAVFFFLFPHTPKCGIIRYLAQKKAREAGGEGALQSNFPTANSYSLR